MLRRLSIGATKGGVIASLLLLVPVVLVLAFTVANRAVYEIASRNGYYCAASPDFAGSTIEKSARLRPFFR
jgi:hypothetical protein